MEHLTDDVLLIVLQEVSNQRNAIRKLARLEQMNRKMARLIKAHYSQFLKKIMIKAPKSTPTTSISINGCKFTDVEESDYDSDQQSVFLDSFHDCLSYLLSRASVITSLVTKGFFKFRTAIPQLYQISEYLTSCPKVQLKTLSLTSFWTELLTGVLINNSSALRILFMTTSGIESPLEKLNLTLDKFILTITLVDAADQQRRLKNLLDFLTDGGSRAEHLMIKAGFVPSMYSQEDDAAFTSLIQQLAPSSLMWNGIVINYFGFGTVEDGDISQPGSWLEVALKNGIVMENLRVLDIKQAYLQNWGHAPFNFINLKTTFPNLKTFRMSSTYQIDLVPEIAKVRYFIADLFENWPDLDAEADFRFMRLARHAAVIDYTEEQKEVVQNEPRILGATLTNLAFIKTCVRDHRHLQPKLEVVSTGKARIILEFIVNACNPGEQQPVGGVAGTVHRPSEEDKCTFLSD